MPTDDEMPATIKRSPAKARRTWTKTHDSALQTYGEGERARSLGVRGRSSMSKEQLAEAIARKQ